jgi:ABC-type spermidine/putrescine transport system permease subunit II
VLSSASFASNFSMLAQRAGLVSSRSDDVYITVVEDSDDSDASAHRLSVSIIVGTVVGVVAAAAVVVVAVVLARRRRPSTTPVVAFSVLPDSTDANSNA